MYYAGHCITPHTHYIVCRLVFEPLVYCMYYAGHCIIPHTRYIVCRLVFEPLVLYVLCRPLHNPPYTLHRVQAGV